METNSSGNTVIEIDLLAIFKSANNSNIEFKLANIFEKETLSSLSEDDELELNNLLIECLLSIEDDGILDTVVELIQTLIASKKLNTPSLTALMGKNNIERLTFEHGCYRLYERLTGKKPDEDWIEASLSYAVYKSDMALVDKLLTRNNSEKWLEAAFTKSIYVNKPKNIQTLLTKNPSPVILGNALVLSTQLNTTNITSLLLTNNTLLHEFVIKALNQAIMYKHVSVSIFIDLLGENKLLDSELNNAFSLALNEKWINKFIINPFLRDQRLAHKSVVEALTRTIDKQHLDILDAILNLANKNQVSLAELDNALRDPKNSLHSRVMILNEIFKRNPEKSYISATLEWAIDNGLIDIKPFNKDIAPKKDSIELILDNAPNLVEDIDKLIDKTLTTKDPLKKALILEKLLMVGARELNVNQHIEPITDREERLALLDKYLKQLKTFDLENQELKSITSVLDRVHQSLAVNCNRIIVGDYLSRKAPELGSSINRLQSCSKTKTCQNILATIASFLLCLTGFGIIVAYNQWQDNLKKHGSSFMFFTKGAKQSAEVAKYQAEQLAPKPG